MEFQACKSTYFLFPFLNCSSIVKGETFFRLLNFSLYRNLLMINNVILDIRGRYSYQSGKFIYLRINAPL